MAILHVCAVLDTAIQSYGRPIFVPAVGAALRSFVDEVNRADKDNMLHNHPSDFTLFELGTFDDGTGEFSCHQPTPLIRGKDVKNDAP